jgi:hypothetical protein
MIHHHAVPFGGAGGDDEHEDTGINIQPLLQVADRGDIEMACHALADNNEALELPIELFLAV